MIYFQTKPDPVFNAILQEALISEAVEIKLLADDGAIESWEGLYPESSRRLTPYSAVRMLHQMLAAFRDANVYRLSDDYWLVLYECIRNFCATHNDLLEDFGNGFRPVGDFRIGVMDDDAIVNIYFWDTDFLLPPQRELWEFWPNEQEMEAPDEGPSPLRSTMEDMVMLELVEDVAWVVPAEDEFFRPGSLQYPDPVYGFHS